MSKIKILRAREIMDSRGNPTVEVDIQTDQGVWARASVPSGASTGRREAWELRDGDPNRFMGKGVQRAVANINGPLAQLLVGEDVDDGPRVDQLMLQLDGTENKKNLGANALLAVSLCVARAASYGHGQELFSYLSEHLYCPRPGEGALRLPAPMMNIINGGCHGANNLDIQEFMIIPHLNRPFRENLRAGVEVFHALKEVLKQGGYSTNVGDEGGFSPPLGSHREAMDLILKAMEKAHYRPGEDISLALDCAASEFYNEEDGTYKLEGKVLTSQEVIEELESFVKNYPLYSIEDGLAEDDHRGWREMTEILGDQVLLIGDDLFVTNPQIFQQGIEAGEANAILIKPNQIGTLFETFETLALAFEHNYQAVISHRSGETADHFIADLAVASGCGHIKAGSASRVDRVEKYNQLLRLEQLLGGDQALYHRVK